MDSKKLSANLLDYTQKEVQEVIKPALKDFLEIVSTQSAESKAADTKLAQLLIDSLAPGNENAVQQPSQTSPEDKGANSSMHDVVAKKKQHLPLQTSSVLFTANFSGSSKAAAATETDLTTKKLAPICADEDALGNDGNDEDGEDSDDDALGDNDGEGGVEVPSGKMATSGDDVILKPSGAPPPLEVAVDNLSAALASVQVGTSGLVSPLLHPAQGNLLAMPTPISTNGDALGNDGDDEDSEDRDDDALVDDEDGEGSDDEALDDEDDEVSVDSLPMTPEFSPGEVVEYLGESSGSTFDSGIKTSSFGVVLAVVKSETAKEFRYEVNFQSSGSTATIAEEDLIGALSLPDDGESGGGVEDLSGETATSGDDVLILSPPVTVNNLGAALASVQVGASGLLSPLLYPAEEGPPPPGLPPGPPPGPLPFAARARLVEMSAAIRRQSKFAPSAASSGRASSVETGAGAENVLSDESMLNVEPIPPYGVAQHGTFRITGKFGAGENGKVFEAMSSFYGRVAVKFVSEGSEDFNREIACWKKLGSHPNIVSLYAFFHQGLHWRDVIVEEALDTTLFEGVYPKGTEKPPTPFCFLELINTAVSASRVLVVLDANKLVHSDLKLENVGKKNGVVKVLDFGKGAATGTVVNGCTELYMAPEIEWGTLLDPNQDTFAFGCLLREAATGEDRTKWSETVAWSGFPLPGEPGRCFARFQAKMMHLPHKRPSASACLAFFSTLLEEVDCGGGGSGGGKKKKKVKKAKKEKS